MSNKSELSVAATLSSTPAIFHAANWQERAVASDTHIPVSAKEVCGALADGARLRTWAVAPAGFDAVQSCFSLGLGGLIENARRGHGVVAEQVGLFATTFAASNGFCDLSRALLARLISAPSGLGLCSDKRLDLSCGPIRLAFEPSTDINRRLRQRWDGDTMKAAVVEGDPEQVDDLLRAIEHGLGTGGEMLQMRATAKLEGGRVVLAPRVHASAWQKAHGVFAAGIHPATLRHRLLDEAMVDLKAPLHETFTEELRAAMKDLPALRDWMRTPCSMRFAITLLRGGALGRNWT